MSTLLAIVEEADSLVLKCWALEEPFQRLEVVTCEPPRVSWASETDFPLCAPVPLRYDFYRLRRLIRNDWGKLEACWYKFEKTERR